MHLENFETTNLIEIRGQVVSEFSFSHEVYGEGFYNFYIEVPRLSETSDILMVTVSERLASHIPEGAYVSVIGQVRSYNNYVQEENRNKLIITVFAREIEELNDIEEIRMKNPNSVYLNGFICKEPVFRKTPFGREIADLLLAVNRSYNKSDYIPCILWGRNARFVSGLSVGDNIKISGRMQSRLYQKKYENGDIVEKTAFEVSVSKVEII
ncbi:single-stranded DNA-binding protein [Anaeropeptidivorans aminofermentans]|jgi:primosomal replication protein N|uniref:single-stranded DNA-binding protein n=1 Tax=Anaeropeptidivorans aminofermentans TaxID=2934315 RepID=UPI002024159E|nr:single-stranded DNA-binding protein [Anaeropeptidivorans aminofermentans]MBE6012630.1 single-stranded DNA-binding protein [Lachnospiraceae bacterium]